MAYKRGVLLTQTVDQRILNELYCHAVVNRYYGAYQESFDPNDVAAITDTLGSGDAIFTDTLEVFGGTQEAVLKALEVLVTETGIRIFLLNPELDIIEVTPNIVRLIQQFRRLDVILVKRAA